MILYQNALMTLDYDPTTDILVVDWPALDSFTKMEAGQTLEKLVEMIRTYDIKKLVVDASKTKLTLTDTDHLEMVNKFTADLFTTRLQKFARVRSTDDARESRLATFIKEQQLPVDFSNFNSMAEAMEWLKAG